MKKTVRDTLKRAVEQLFVRLHSDLMSEIHPDKTQKSEMIYDDLNPKHRALIALCKEKIGYAPLATNQEIYCSIMHVYLDFSNSENERFDSRKSIS